MPFDEMQAWTKLKGVIVTSCNFNCADYNDAFLQRRVLVRLQAHGISSYGAYSQILILHPEERPLLLRELAIHVTNFFRNIDTFEVFMAQTLMELLKRKEQKGSKTIRIWSAGCSSGEEPYSVAMMFLEILQQGISDYFISIIGTDISAEIIENAKAGIYSEAQLRETPPEYIEKYFTRQGYDFVVNDDVKKLVQFQTSDLLRDSMPQSIDVLFCRNTIIYFEREAKEKLFDKFYQIINSEGYLILGMTEAISGAATKLFLPYDNTHRIYKKEGK